MHIAHRFLNHFSNTSGNLEREIGAEHKRERIATNLVWFAVVGALAIHDWLGRWFFFALCCWSLIGWQRTTVTAYSVGWLKNRFCSIRWYRSQKYSSKSKFWYKLVGRTVWNTGYIKFNLWYIKMYSYLNHQACKIGVQLSY